MERLTEHAHVSKRTFHQHFPRESEFMEEYLRRIHQAGGLPSEQAIDNADAPPRGRALALESTPGGHLRDLPLRNAAVQAGQNVNQSVCLTP